jgi:xylulokinase
MLRFPIFLTFVAVIIDRNLKVHHEAKVDFDADLPQFGTRKGVLSKPSTNEIYSPVAMWLEALDLLLSRLEEQKLDFPSIKSISGAAIQHGTVFWSKSATQIISTLDPKLPLAVQTSEAFTHPFSPNWQDASTESQCIRFDKALGGKQELASVTGSSAHHRFSGPQILKFQEEQPTKYEQTSRISLVSSFLASIFLGKIAPIDCADASGMNLLDIKTQTWHKELLNLINQDSDDLFKKLGEVNLRQNTPLGHISSYFVLRYGFSSSCIISPFTGDNPSTLLSLPLTESDAIISLGTSSTLLMSTKVYKPSPDYHVMLHPTVPGAYMVMLCYKNGALARERVRDALDPPTWDHFDKLALQTPLLSKHGQSDARVGIYFPLPEILPPLPSCDIRAQYDPINNKLTKLPTALNNEDPRTLLESQFLSMRLRSAPLLSSSNFRPRRIFLAGGGSANAAIVRICGGILGPTEGVWKAQESAGNSCAIGAARRAAWVCEGGKLGWEEWIGTKEVTGGEKVDEGYREVEWKEYEDGVSGLAALEKMVRDG